MQYNDQSGTLLSILLSGPFGRQHAHINIFYIVLAPICSFMKRQVRQKITVLFLTRGFSACITITVY